MYLSLSLLFILLIGCNPTANFRKSSELTEQLSQVFIQSPLIITPVDSSTVMSNVLTITGTGKPGMTIDISGPSAQSCTTTVLADGSYSCTLSSFLSEGFNEIEVVQKDSSGNKSKPVAVSVNVNDCLDSVSKNLFEMRSVVYSHPNSFPVWTSMGGLNHAPIVDGNLSSFETYTEGNVASVAFDFGAGENDILKSVRIDAHPANGFSQAWGWGGSLPSVNTLNVISASNDGVSWIDLPTTVSGIPGGNSGYITFSTTNNTAYRYYGLRINFTSGWADTNYISEMTVVCD
ncbi:MAG: Ig-like domain-containing protein [Bacteriovoracaceae bacterium]|nr:Ig-like domain-containing protein [Bacteriovoracaceae bacterium]